MKRKVRVAAVQASPVFPLSKAATTDKICHLIDEAARNGAELIVFPETFLPAYPNFSVNLDVPNQWRDNLALLQEESVTLNGPELARIRAGLAGLGLALRRRLHGGRRCWRRRLARGDNADEGGRGGGKGQGDTHVSILIPEGCNSW